MTLKLLIFLLLYSSLAKAGSTGLDYFLRFENWSTSRTQDPRAIFGTTLTANLSNFNFYLDGFLETDQGSLDTREWRRAQDRAYLQELYGEFAGSSFFIRVGKQAARWSDSWSLPSLDVWTARKYDRLFLDPLAQQLSHSTGLLLSYVGSSWSVDVAFMSDVAKDRFPEPYPELFNVDDPEGVNPGVRLKLDLNGLQTTLINARALRKNYYGTAFSYAFDKWVPKTEFGYIRNEQIDPMIVKRNQYFGSLGADIFLAELTLTPQLTVSDGIDPFQENLNEVIYYLSATYTHKKHEVQFIGYNSSEAVDTFLSLGYTYFVTKSWAFSFIMQNYQGNTGMLTEVVQDQNQGNYIGLRLQFNDGVKTR